MGQVKILKTVSLEFLGDGYEEAYVRFHALPTQEYPEWIKQANEAEGDGESAKVILEMVKQQFKDGRFPDENGEWFDLKKDNMGEFDIDTVTRIFRRLTGQEEDPK